MQTLLEFLPRFRELGDREAMRFHNGFRTWKLSYSELYRRIAGFARRLDELGIKQGDRLMLWCENRPEWAIVFWACVARGVHVVPIDFHSSPEFVRRIQGDVGARIVVYGEATEHSEMPGLSMADIGAPEDDEVQLAEVSPDDVVEIVYTSGTTGQPVGISHRHRNICANLRPIATEIDKYRNLARPFQPVRTLNLLPLSHMFGQSLGLFIPALLGGAVAFMTDFNPGSVIRTIKRERISVLTCVPRLLTTLQQHVERQFDLRRGQNRLGGKVAILERSWRYRDVHRAFGWKFWAHVVGGARVEPETEAFWARLGFLVIQGYGLTETSPVVALNHPFNARQGSIGKPIAGQEVRIAPDGEILVRGENVVAEHVAADGWLHTGDIGEIDSEGRLYYKGRKKEVIVTSEGLNVYPQDVEAVLNRQPEVREAVAVAATRDGQEVVHAALILNDSSADPQAIVERANRQLEAHQRVRSWSVWPAGDFPRTESTQKVKRGAVAATIATGKTDSAGATDLDSLIARASGDISSLERVELLSEIESRSGVQLDEKRFTEARTTDELKVLIREAETATHAPSEGIEPTPRWSRVAPVRWARIAALETIVLPGFRLLMDVSAEGIENLASVKPPVIFASNHLSHLDTPAIFLAAPLRWRHRLAPAMSQDYFRAWFNKSGHPLKEILDAGLQYYVACGLFNAYPLPQRMSGVRRALRYTGELIDAGFCPLVYPEGLRSPDGEMKPFRSGIGMMAAQLRVPIVPVHLRGTFEVYSVHHERPKPGPVRVRIGTPLRFEASENYEAIARQVEEAVAELAGKASPAMNWVEDAATDNVPPLRRRAISLEPSAVVWALS